MGSSRSTETGYASAVDRLSPNGSRTSPGYTPRSGRRRGAQHARCGIGAILGPEETAVSGLESRLATINRLLAHRGPDGEGLWAHPAGHVGFAHRRLEIIDLATGDQPMRDEAGNWITYNGEIYNYLELRKELGESQFRTTSDTEVVLRAYRKWGSRCVEHLRGMFAFAIW